MEPSDREKFAEILTVMGEVYGKEVSPMKIEAYWQGLKDLALSAIQDHANTHIRTKVFFPTPADLRGASSRMDIALLAWVVVEQQIHKNGYYTSVQFDDPVIHSAVQAMGGWISLYNDYYQDNKRPFLRKEFIECYNAVQNKRTHPTHLIGWSEQENTRNGYLDAIPKPKQITTGYITPERQLEAHDADNGHAVQRHA